MTTRRRLVPSRRQRLSAVMAVAMSAAVAGCSSGSGGAARSRVPAPPPAPVIEVTMVDHRFEIPSNIPAGRVVFRMPNAGRSPHNLTMLPLEEDVPPIDVQLAGSDRRFVAPFAGFYDRQPGEAGTFAVDLAPGQRYALICSVVAEDGEPHWKKGMAIEFRTPPADAPGDP